MRRVIGIDGCPSGWIGVAQGADGQDPEILFFHHFSDVIAHPDDFAIIAVDMPIGLPDAIVGSGRGPEQAVRPLLGKRQSSVFSIPARAAVEEPDYRKACAIALERSAPPRRISKQSFNIFPKILEIDRLMSPVLEARVHEVHPELAFWRMNGERALLTAKKIRSRVNPDGMAERRQLLLANGFRAGFLDRVFLDVKRSRGAAMDDFFDACAATVMARRALHGLLQPFPSDFARDAKGLRVAIWA